jgi:hypothetical protein
MDYVRRTSRATAWSVVWATCAASTLSCRGATLSTATARAIDVAVLTDGHSPSPFRADTVRNLDPWYAAFDVRAGAKLFLAPADRVRVW